MKKEQEKLFDAALAKALEEAGKLGLQAAKEDGWMQPCFEDAKFKDYGDDLSREEEGWSETDHFGVFYLSKLAILANGVIDRETDKQDLWVGVLSELRGAFWDAWGSTESVFNTWKKMKKEAKK